MKEIANGVWPVMITPFTEDNKIDYDAVLQIIEWYDKMGVTGIFAVCQSSEMFFLNKEERLQLAKFVIDNTPKHIGVVVSGHVAERPEDQVREAQAIIDAGADSYVFISNQFAKEGESEDVAKKSIEYLTSNIQAESFGIYECPYPYKRIVSPELLKWCAETGKFSFLKDTCCDLDMIQAKCEAVKGTPLKIFNANGATLLRSLQMGCAGYSGVMANFHADLYAWLCVNYTKEPEKAEKLMNFLGSASTIECQIYPVNAKYHMQLEGLNMTLMTRTRSAEELTGSKRLEIEQYRATTQMFREYFFG
ncbi:MAG: dihydrodipicolinate synthase family protein [Lachnospiraceae bacterium]|nr:dihydrodipicolinate synthase family protein [Lachnospiraceae bacterium]